LIARYETELADLRAQVSQHEGRENLASRVQELSAQLEESEGKCTQLESQITAAGRILDRLREHREELKNRLIAGGLEEPES